ncbi:hypothetical protein BV61_02035 [Candidatus Synechococcus spongiarum LMB bulk15M]|uniref:Uncharacterized protein n=1 Tax=Candidatus Synechococcus spongiarum LMB bulk15M TaxID=1943582 RepID=A0A1T1D1V7_9SYNE|nr:hypothetical protein BV61_02035 [Candidatus Synechococcus spongiarum LMB bulk15M]OOV36788.1 hypothetical protein BO98_00305 [Candidatus Synechococcus spongiarum LMB bulk10D]
MPIAFLGNFIKMFLKLCEDLFGDHKRNLTIESNRPIEQSMDSLDIANTDLFSDRCPNNIENRAGIQQQNWDAFFFNTSCKIVVA